MPTVALEATLSTIERRQAIQQVSLAQEVASSISRDRALSSLWRPMASSRRLLRDSVCGKKIILASMIHHNPAYLKSAKVACRVPTRCKTGESQQSRPQAGKDPSTAPIKCLSAHPSLLKRIRQRLIRYSSRDKSPIQICICGRIRFWVIRRASSWSLPIAWVAWDLHLITNSSISS